MKEFEKWDENNKVNYATFSGGQLSVKNERCKSWKAALEWVARRGMLHYGIDFLIDMKELSQDIKQELK